MEYALTTKGLSKSYGSKLALNGLDMNVPSKMVYGFLGINGAGKTTTFGIIGRFTHATSGEFEAKGRISVLPQDARFYGSRTLLSQLSYFAKLSGVPRAKARAEAERVLQLVGLIDQKHMLASKISHGMYKRLGIAQALLGNPDVLLLDEPTSGLDPDNAARLRELIYNLKRDMTVVISSHNLMEISGLCEMVGVIHKGKMVYEGSITQLTEHNSTVDYVLADELESKPDWTWIQRQSWNTAQKTLSLSFDSTTISLVDVNWSVTDYLKQQKIGVLEIRRGRSLEASFLELLSSEP